MRLTLPLKHLSSRFHLAMGLTSLVVSVLLTAQFLGLVPDRDAALRDARVSLAETVALGSMVLLDDEEPGRLQQLLDGVQRRHPALHAIVLLRADGQVHLQVGQPAVPDSATAASDAGGSTETHLRLPLVREGAPWGRVELQFAPLRAVSDWRSWLGSSELLVTAVALCCFALFYVYLRRMLRHLDPARVIPGRVRTAFDTLAEGLLIVDPSGRILLANRTFSQTLGKDPEALFQMPVADLDWRQPDDSGVPWQEVFTAGQSQRNLLMRLRDASGRSRTFMVNVSPVSGGGDHAAGTLISLDDVTALEEKEVQLRLARDEAEAANRAKSDFLANMSHEIRTPMNAILGFAELLRRGWQTDPQDTHRHLDTILGSGRHLLALINDILDLSKVEAGRMEVERVPCAVHQVVHEVADIMRLRAQEKGVALAVAFPGPLPAQVLTDPARVRQIVTNLIGNALKFTLQGGVTVTLRMAQAGVGADATPRLAIDITDTGIGIPADKLDAIFEPFVQAEASTTRQFGGTGLGLAISRRFARALGGDVTVSSVPGQGSTFHVLLDTGPLDGLDWLTPQALSAVEERPQARGGATYWAFDAGCVLVVDDGAENRELVRLVLESAGLTVLEAHDGAMALEVVAREQPDLVLMDVNMPVMDGYTATRTLRERGCTLPVLALTANAMKGFEREIESAGFTGYLTKPVDIDVLLTALAERLAGRQVAGEMPAPQSVRPSAGRSELAAVGDPIASRLADHPRLSRVVRTFGHTLPGKLAAMQAALDGGRLDDLADLAHWLKGAGGTVGFDVFFEPAREFERLARAGDTAELERVMRQIQALARRIVIPHGEAAEAATPA